jgi:hypothetical protein
MRVRRLLAAERAHQNTRKHPRLILKLPTVEKKGIKIFQIEMFKGCKIGLDGLSVYIQKIDDIEQR